MRIPPLSVIVIGLSASLPAHCTAQTFQTIYQCGAYPDAQTPQGLLAEPDGTLVGVATNGGIYGYGAVFQLQPPSVPSGTWTESVVYSFAPQNGDGPYPVASPAMRANGTLCGTTAYFSPTDGTVYEVRPPATPHGSWTETVLFRSAGTGLQGSLISVVPGPHGEVFGTSGVGGYCGAVFELTPPPLPGETYTESVISTTGCDPPGLAVARNGTLYGVTVGGVDELPYLYGMVFALTPPSASGGTWNTDIIYSFSGGADGYQPSQPPVIGSDGVIYGTTSLGGSAGVGTVFSLAPPGKLGGAWTETTLYSLPDSALGAPSSALLVRGGRIFGTTATTYSASQGGSIFELRKPSAPGGPWTETTLYQFPSGQLPSGSLVLLKDGSVCGTTNSGYQPGLPTNSGMAYCISGIQ